MRFERGNIGFFLAFLIISGILGSSLGTLISRLSPDLAIIKKNLTAPIGFNLEIISFHLKLNISAIVGMIIGIVIFRRI